VSNQASVQRELMRFPGTRGEDAGRRIPRHLRRPGAGDPLRRGAIAEAARSLGLEVRIGLHSGEVELMVDDLGGIAVHIAARVGALAAPGEVLVSSTVKDLVAGSGIGFVDRGAERLKGSPTNGGC
jgi:class 3 adenylate cyclase